MMKNWSAWSPYLLSLLRVVVALLFLEHGLMKLWHFPAAQPGAPNPLPPILMLAAWLEVIGGVLVAAGLFTRPAAYILSGEMAFAYFMGHFPKSPWPGVNGGDAAILFCFVFLYLSSAGPGPIALDALRDGKRGPARRR